MKKIKGLLISYLDKLLSGLMVAGLAYIATLGDWFCHIAGVNRIYCDPFIIRRGSMPLT